MSMVSTLGRCVNTVVMPLVERWSGWPRQVGGRSMGVFSYQGRRTGRAVRIVVNFRRTNSGVAIVVEMPEQKQWWRNFTGKGWPAVIEVAGRSHAGHAVASRDPQGGVQVGIEFTDPAPVPD